MKLQVYLPYDKKYITQRFGDNANPLYQTQGLKGHTAYDWGVPFGTPIPNCVANAYCYSVMHKDDPNLMDYRGVFFVVEDPSWGDTAYEISYGHCSTLIAEVGKTYQVGDIIAKVGNTGPVYVGQHEVTAQEKQQGSQAGAHLHGPQIRILKKTKYENTFDNYIYDSNGLLNRNGYYYGIPDYDNGYNGCVSMRNYSTEIVAGTVNAPKVQTVANTIPVIAQVVQELPSVPEPQKSSLISQLQQILATLLSLLK